MHCKNTLMSVKVHFINEYGDRILTNDYILRVALEQSAIDSSCKWDDFLAEDNKVVISNNNAWARKYLELPFVLDMTSYGHNIVASVSPDVKDIAYEYINKYSMAHCFETPNLHVLMNKLKPLGYDVCFMAEYFLPDVSILHALPCQYTTCVLQHDELQELYLPELSNALCEKRKELDVIAVGAFDNGKLIGLAGASADCEMMWQIGVDVLNQYRHEGVASALTSRLACEIIDRGRVPFYCCAWSNIASARNAIKSGFKPSWVQVTAQSIQFIDNMNKS